MRRISLRSLLVIPFVLQAVGIVTLMGYWSYRSGQQAVEGLAHELITETSLRVEGNLTTDFSRVRSVTESAAALAQQNSLDSTDASAFQAYVLQQGRMFPDLRQFSMATVAGDTFSATRLQRDRWLIRQSSAELALPVRQHIVDPAGNRLDSEAAPPEPLAPEPLSKTWASSPLRNQRLGTWSIQGGLFPGRQSRDVYLAYRVPFYGADGQFQGVVETASALTQSGRLAASLNMASPRQVFIVDRDGLLVATSLGESPFRAEPPPANPSQRLPATASRNEVVQAAAETLALRGNLSPNPLNRTQVLHFSLDSERYVMQARPLRRDLKWLVISVIPESTFEGVIRANAQRTALFGGVSLVGSLWIGIWLSRHLIRPILALKQASQGFVRGNSQPTMRSTRIGEVESLRRSFQEMMAQLNITFEAMEASEQKLSSLLESLPIGVAVYAQGKFVFVNRKGEEIFTGDGQAAPVQGPAPAQLYFTGTDRPYPPAELPWRRGLQGEAVYVDDLDLDVGDRRVPLEVYVTPVVGEIGEILYAIIAFQDITVRRQAIQAQAAFDKATDALFLIDSQTLQIVDCNQHAVELFEAADRTALIGQKRDALYKGDHPLQIPISCEEPEPWSLELECISRRGNPFWGFFSVKQITVADKLFTLVRVTDISDRKRAETALKESQAKFQRLVDDIGEKFVVFSHAGPSGTVTYVSGGFYAVFGLKSEEIIGQPWHGIINWLPEDMAMAASAVKQLLESQIEFQQFEMRFVHPEGELRTISVSQHPVRDNAGRLLAVEGILEDVTERKRAEQELIQARDTAERTNQAKSAFIANVSHELRSPLNSILGFAELLQLEETLTPAQRENAGLISRSGRHLLTIINQVLDLAKIEADQIELVFEPINTRKLLDDLRSLFILKAKGQGLQFLIETDGALPEAFCSDSVKLRQILINLLDNAFKFTDSGHVRLSVALRPSPQEAADDQEAETAWLSFSVEDTGSGIAPEDIDLLFEPFSQAQAGQRYGRGSGLGLHISREYVQMMGGTIGLNSTPGKGSTFQFEVPVRLAPALPASPMPHPKVVIGLAAGQPRYRLLIVDDNPDNRRLLLGVLSVLAVELRDAASGEAAIDQWQQWQPHLIWMDLRMPGIDGLEATRRIRAREDAQGALPKIVAISATATVEMTSAALKAGCDDFVSKPFRQAEVFAALQRQLEVTYLYAEETPQENPNQRLAEGVEALGRLPAELRQALENALVLGDPDQIAQAVRRVEPHSKDLFDAIAAKTHDLDYQAVLTLLRHLS